MSYLQPCFGYLKNALARGLYARENAIKRRAVRAMSTFYSQKPVPQLDHISSNHQEMYQLSIKDPDFFWGQLGASRLKWISNFHTVRNSDLRAGKHEWFIGGQINVSENCLDRHVAKDPNRIALIWEKDEPGKTVHVSYRELMDDTSRIANALKRQGVKKGDRVCIYMPVSPIGVASMLACARIGAVHSVVFAGFSADALASRIQDAGAKVLLTADAGIRGGKRIPLKKTVDEALRQCPEVRTVFVAQRTGANIPMHPDRDIYLDRAMESESSHCEPEPMDSEDTLFILYTSGSTGQPKGVMHSQAGYILYASLTQQLCFNYKPGDIYACVADIGWITGHSYVVYGPLVNGATTVLFESTPTYPDPGRYWEMIERLQVNQFYGAPTSIRMLLRFGDEYVKKYNRSSLKVLGTVGEPINEEAWHWYKDVVGEGRCPVVDSWWQTETGGAMIVPYPGPENQVWKPSCPLRPFFGVDPVILDEKGNEMHGDNVSGLLCLRSSTPGMSRGVYGNFERHLDTYYRPYPGYYFTGDGARRDIDGHYHITGRVDDVMNIKGVRLGTAEVEDIMDNHHNVAETAVVGYPHEIKGEGVYAYVILKDGVTVNEEVLKEELRKMVKKAIGSHAVPEMIQISPGLPKTRSGKIMRRILRSIAANRFDKLGDVSTLAEPTVVNGLILEHEKLLEAMEKKG
ncbi:acetyl-coenzyme A synthetase 2-like, mitochondrial [Rhopilema esculentum]|uniref:acetyl-coenzyme A synthetase 2-like, mitochondrial n=1 Tax=Rhopilema esculentum TaxID=499914 RepID=UPI0031DC18BF